MSKAGQKGRVAQQEAGRGIRRILIKTANKDVEIPIRGVVPSKSVPKCGVSWKFDSSSEKRKNRSSASRFFNVLVADHLGGIELAPWEYTRNWKQSYEISRKSLAIKFTALKGFEIHIRVE